MIAIVCGGRTYSNAARVNEILDAAVTRLGLACIIEGECPTPVNADKLARKWAEARGDISFIAVPAGDKWPEAGPVRNKLMLEILMGSAYGDDRAVFAFPGKNGTANMVAQARGKGVKIYEIDKQN